MKTGGQRRKPARGKVVLSDIKLRKNDKFDFKLRNIQVANLSSFSVAHNSIQSQHTRSKYQPSGFIIKGLNFGKILKMEIQEIELDKHIRLLDSPGVVLLSNKDIDPIELMLHYTIPEFKSVDQFLALVARKLGRLKKGARPDITAAAKHVNLYYLSNTFKSVLFTQRKKYFCFEVFIIKDIFYIKVSSHTTILINI
uniref:OBG-type G domain-containing protein n=1 Tax=Heterorhabditis bacteriophora TaxID=37862 RepID=A0A1I7WZY3_HETBA